MEVQGGRQGFADSWGTCGPRGGYSSSKVIPSESWSARVCPLHCCGFHSIRRDLRRCADVDGTWHSCVFNTSGAFVNLGWRQSFVSQRSRHLSITSVALSFQSSALPLGACKGVTVRTCVEELRLVTVTVHVLITHHLGGMVDSAVSSERRRTCRQRTDGGRGCAGGHWTKVNDGWSMTRDLNFTVTHDCAAPLWTRRSPAAP